MKKNLGILLRAIIDAIVILAFIPIRILIFLYGFVQITIFSIRDGDIFEDGFKGAFIYYWLTFVNGMVRVIKLELLWIRKGNNFINND